MAGRKSSIGAQLTLDKRGFKAALDGAKQDAGAFKAGLEQMKISKGALAGEGFRVGKWTELSSKINVIGGGLRGIGSAGLKVGKALYESEASFENLLRGLASTSDGSETLREELEKLQVVAQMPGLGFREAIQGATALKAAKLSASEAREALVAFGNALTNAGKGKAELNDVIMSIQQIMSTGQVDMENLKEISARIPGFLELAARVPKSNAREWVAGIVKELKQLPTAALSASDEVQNMLDEVDQARLKLSGGAAVGTAKKLSAAARSILEADGLTSIVDKGIEALKGGEDEDMIGKYQPTETELARRKKVKDELAAAEAEQKRLAEQKVKDDAEAAKKAQLAATKPQREEAQASLEVLRLRAAGKNKKADELQQQQAKTARRAQLEAAGMSPGEAAVMASEEMELNKAIASGRRKTYKGEADTGLTGLAAFDDMQERMDRRPLSEEQVYTGLYRRSAPEKSAKKEAAAAAGSRANATAGDPVTKALGDMSQKMVQGLDNVASKIEGQKPKFFDLPK